MEEQTPQEEYNLLPIEPQEKPVTMKRVTILIIIAAIVVLAINSCAIITVKGQINNKPLEETRKFLKEKGFKDDQVENIVINAQILSAVTYINAADAEAKKSQSKQQQKVQQPQNQQPINQEQPNQ